MLKPRNLSMPEGQLASPIAPVPFQMLVKCKRSDLLQGWIVHTSYTVVFSLKVWLLQLGNGETWECEVALS